MSQYKHVFKALLGRAESNCLYDSPVRPGLPFRALIRRQKIHVGHGTVPALLLDLVVMSHVATVRAAVGIDEPAMLPASEIGCPIVQPITEASLSQADDHGRQGEDGGERSQSHKNGVDDHRSLSERNRP